MTSVRTTGTEVADAFFAGYRWGGLLGLSGDTLPQMTFTQINPPTPFRVGSMMVTFKLRVTLSTASTDTFTLRVAAGLLQEPTTNSEDVEGRVSGSVGQWLTYSLPLAFPLGGFGYTPGNAFSVKLAVSSDADDPVPATAAVEVCQEAISEFFP